MASKTTERALECWAGRVRAGMGERPRRLIDLAVQNLSWGPLGDEEGLGYPGFTAACHAIREALSGLPYEVWVDVESGEVLESEPQGYMDEEDGWQEPEWADLVHLEGREVLAALVGRELAGYVV